MLQRKKIITLEVIVGNGVTKQFVVNENNVVKIINRSIEYPNSVSYVYEVIFKDGISVAIENCPVIVGYHYDNESEV